MELDMNGIVKMIYPDGSDSGNEITVRCLVNLIRRARYGYFVEVFAAPVLVGVAVGLMYGNRDKIEKLFQKKEPQNAEKMETES